MSPSRPGYVYVLAHPRWPAWFKVGHTHRPPHVRAQELSRTAVPESFELEHARFVWDAPGVERWVHTHLEQQLGPQSRRKEFFHGDLASIKNMVTVAPRMPSGKIVLSAVVEEDEPWRWAETEGLTAHDLEDRWGWAEEQWSSRDIHERRRGWAAMEALSSSGWGEASWRLAEAMMRRSPTPVTASRAVWVLDAAAEQGVDAARWRAGWVRSFVSEADLSAWVTLRDQLHAHYQGLDLSEWPDRDRATWEADIKASEQDPNRPAPPCLDGSSSLMRPWPRR